MGRANWSGMSSHEPRVKPRAVDALLFDVGGVLVDVDFASAFDHWARCAGVPARQIAERFKVDADYEAHERGEIDGTQYFAALRRSLDINIPDHEFDAGWCAIFRGVYPDAAELLAELAAQKPVYLFSNTNALHYARWRMLYPQIIAPARQVFCSQELGLRKPSAASFDTVCALIGMAPGRIAFFDDLAENVEAARQSGLHGFHVATPGSLRHTVAQGLTAEPMNLNSN